MTIKDLEVKSATLESLRAQWQARLLPTIDARVGDGRASILRINASPSYAAAQSRLDELWTWLAGPSETSLRGKVRDAREQFYRQAAILHFPLIPEALRARQSPDPTRDQIRMIRAAAIHGYDPRKTLEG